MENLKVKVNSETESKEVQELFFELGAVSSVSRLKSAWVCLYKGQIFLYDFLPNVDFKEVTIPQLRDLVVLKRNDVNDATHIGINKKYYLGSNARYVMSMGKWIITDQDFNELKLIEKPMTETEYLMQGKNGEHLMESVEQLKDNVNQPSHYTSGGIECLEAMQAMLSRDEFIGFLRGNVFKYNWRYKLKNGVEDLKKAQFYQKKLIELESDDAI